MKILNKLFKIKYLNMKSYGEKCQIKKDKRGELK